MQGLGLLDRGVEYKDGNLLDYRFQVTPGEYLQALGVAHNASDTHPVELIEVNQAPFLGHCNPGVRGKEVTGMGGNLKSKL